MRRFPDCLIQGGLFLRVQPIYKSQEITGRLPRAVPMRSAVSKGQELAGLFKFPTKKYPVYK